VAGKVAYNIFKKDNIGKKYVKFGGIIAHRGTGEIT